jgi:hypothetical protein
MRPFHVHPHTYGVGGIQIGGVTSSVKRFITKVSNLCYAYATNAFFSYLSGKRVNHHPYFINIGNYFTTNKNDLFAIFYEQRQ